MQTIPKISKFKEILAMGGSFISYMNFIVAIVGAFYMASIWINARQDNDRTLKTSVDELTIAVKDTKEAQAQASAKITEEFNKKFDAAAQQQQVVITRVDDLKSTNQLFSGRLDLQDQKLTQISRQLDSSDSRLNGIEGRVSKNETGLEVLRALYDRIATASKR